MMLRTVVCSVAMKLHPAFAVGEPLLQHTKMYLIPKGHSYAFLRYLIIYKERLVCKSYRV